MITMKLALMLLAICGQTSCLSTPAALENVEEDRTKGFPIIDQDHPGPVKFLTLISDIIRGPGFYGVTREEASSMAEKFYENIKRENSQTNSVGVTAGISFGPASLEVSAKSAWTKSEKHETENEKETATSFASKTVQRVNVPAGKFLLKAAELEMFVFKNKQGKTSRVIIPTTQMIEGVFGPEHFTTHGTILDDSFRKLHWITPGTEIKYWKYLQIQEAILKQHLEIHPIEQESVVDTNYYYQIKNANYRGTGGIKLMAPSTVNQHTLYADCANAVSYSDKLWKFEQDPREKNKYAIVNKRGNMLTDERGGWTKGKDKNCWKGCGKKGGECTSQCGPNGFCCRKGFAGCPKEANLISRGHHSCMVRLSAWKTSTGHQQFWTLTPVGSNFKIATEAGDELAQWGEGNGQCGTFKGFGNQVRITPRDKIWTLIKTKTIAEMDAAPLELWWTKGKDIDCWKGCGKKGGECTSQCGPNGFCCRKGFGGCPKEAALISRGHHSCVVRS